MALLDRIIGTEEPALSSHIFQACCYEWEDGGMSRAEVIAACEISVAEESDLDWLKGLYVVAKANGRADTFAQVVHNVCMLAATKVHYLTKAQITARLNAASGP